MHSLDGSQVRHAQRRTTVEGYLRGGSRGGHGQRHSQHPGGHREGLPGQGVGRPSERRRRVLGPCGLADGAPLVVDAQVTPPGAQEAAQPPSA